VSVPPHSKRQRVSRQDWLEAGLEALAAEGPEGLRIDRLAKKLGVARSGYYWHFENRQDYTEALLQHWAHESTDIVVADRELREMEPRERLRRTAEMVDRYDLGRHDLPLRVWAIREPLVARAVKKVTRRRLDHMRRALDELGFEGDDLDMRSHLLVGYFQSERTVFADLSAAARTRLRPMQLDLLLTPSRKPRR